VQEPEIEITVKILKVAETEKFCVEFSRSAGDQLCFFDAFNSARNELADLVNATA
jgi:hypothetical protein